MRMKAVVLSAFGGLEVLKLAEIECPRPSAQQLLVRVRAAGINRADILQRQGFYPPPHGESPLLGLEIAGEVVELGSAVEGFSLGQRVFGLIPSGGYAEYACLDHRLAHHTPPSWSDSFAAAIVETFYTANEGLFHHGRLQESETVLIHGGSSGVGTTAIQLAAQQGARVFSTVGSGDKASRARALGCDATIDYRNRDFMEEVNMLTLGEGVDLILDLVGGSQLDKNIKILRHKGRLIMVGLLGGRNGELPLGLVIAKRLTIQGTILRPLGIAEKVDIRHRFEQRWWNPLLLGKVEPIIHAEFPLEEVCQAHALMEAGLHFGKLILTLN